MITTPNDYQSLLYRIHDKNQQTKIIKLPKDEPIYKVNLNTRKIENLPEFLSVTTDHRAETIYFEMDRYFDNTDLGREDFACIIQFLNNAPKGKEERGYIYVPPFVDVGYNIEKPEESKIIIPWMIEGPATKYAGPVQFAIKIYKIAKDENGDLEYVYTLNTLPATSKVLQGMNVQEEFNENINITNPTLADQLIERLEALEKVNDIYWLEIKDGEIIHPLNDSGLLDFDNYYEIDKNEGFEEF